MIPKSLARTLDPGSLRLEHAGRDADHEFGPGLPPLDLERAAELTHRRGDDPHPQRARLVDLEILRDAAPLVGDAQLDGVLIALEDDVDRPRPYFRIGGLGRDGDQIVRQTS